ncbi:MAG: DDE transposase family protein, partial [bacterium]|nr:DDE transposase family protein [bacterium]
VLEASLAFQNGMTIPLLTEFLTYTEGDTARNKQDCEQRAFHRLGARIKRFFKRYPIIVLLDGLYANGPIMERCDEYNWQFMIVLQDKSLPTVWEEVYGLRPFQPKNNLSQSWGNRRQRFWWVNDYRVSEVSAFL